MKTNKTRWRRLVWMALSVALVGLGLWAAWPRERLLLNRATKVADTSRWDKFDAVLNTLAFGYYWLSDRRVLFRRADYYDHPNGVYRVYDSRTRLETTPPVLNRALADVDAPYGLDLSPDRKWMIAFEYKRHSFNVVALDGSCHLHYESQGWNELGQWAWTRDNAHFLHFVDRSTATDAPVVKGDILVRSLTNKRPEARYALHTRVPLDEADEIRPNDKGFVLTTSDNDWPPKTISTYETDFGLGHAVERKHTIRIPEGAILQCQKLSPQADRLAFLFEFARVSPVATLLRRLLPSMKLLPSRTLELWVCNIDGSSMHEVGHLHVNRPTPKQSDRLAIQGPSLDWLPDGKRLSFIYNDALYTVPAE